MLSSYLRSILLLALVSLATIVVGEQRVVDVDISDDFSISDLDSVRRVDIKIFFHYDDARIDSTYMENPTNLRLADSLLRDTQYISTLSSIDITAQSSPEGSVAYNRRLSERRRASLEEYFTTQYPQIDSTLWRFSSMAENWDDFHDNLLADPNIPSRDKVLSISSGDREIDAKEWLLKILDGGAPWSYIKENILPSQRYGAGVVFVPMMVPFAPPVAFDMAIPPITFPADDTSHIERRVILAIKTNLLYDLASALNIELELPIGDRFSAAVEWVNPWWHSNKADFTMRGHFVNVGAKYWLGDREKREPLTGWAVGLTAGYSNKYDMQILSTRGVQGTYLTGGATIGYAHAIGEGNWRMEYMLGLGVSQTQYKNYTMVYDTKYDDIKVFDYPWVTKRRTMLVPNQIRVSIGYLIFTNRRARR